MGLIVESPFVFCYTPLCISDNTQYLLIVFAVFFVPNFAL
jgi:hypothetical protein